MAELTVRRPDIKFNRLTRHYWGGDNVKTHFVNALHIILPPGERFFIRTIKEAVKVLADPALKEEARRFAGQEAVHAAEHARLLDHLRDQGYAVDPLLQVISRISDYFEKNVPVSFNAALVAAFEHYTALLSKVGLQNPRYLDDLDPSVRQLLEWHGAEEIEHKATAYDIAMALDDNYVQRILAYLMASGVLWGFIFYILFDNIRRDGELLSRKTFDGLRFMFFGRHMFFPKTFVEFLRYFNPAFHPDNIDDYHIAEDIFKKHSGLYKTAQ